MLGDRERTEVGVEEPDDELATYGSLTRYEGGGECENAEPEW